jgi:hypothetical protein
MMKRNAIAIIVALLLVLGVIEIGAQDRAVFGTVSGKVQIQNAGEQAWQTASEGMEVPIRATVSTGFDGRAILHLGATTLTVRPLTRLRIDELSTQDNVARTNLTMPVGRVRAEVKSTEGARTDFKLRSPVSTAAVRGTGFETDGVNLTVFESNVSFSSQSGISINVGTGETGVASGGSTPSGGADQREANTSVDTSTSPTEGGGNGGGVPGNGAGTIVVNWQ